MKKKLEALDSFLIDNFVLSLCFFTGLAFLLRLWAFLSIQSSLYFDYMLFDERIYHNWATGILNGTWHSKEVYEFAPGPAYFTAFLYKVFSPDINVIRSTNVLLGTLTCLFTGLAGLELKGKRTALFSLFLSVFYSPFIFYSIVPLKTALSVFLFALFLWLFLKTLNKNSGFSIYFLLGLVAGTMVNVRPNYLVVIPVAFLFTIATGRFYKHSVKRLLIYTSLLGISFILCILPFILRNYLVAGKVALTASQSGFNLYIGNNLENKMPYYRPVPFASSSPFQQGIQFNIEASKRKGKILSAQEASSFWTREVIKIAIEQPGAFCVKLFQKTLIYFNSFEAGDHYHIGFMKNFITFFKLPLITFWLILPFGMAGLMTGAFECRKKAALASIFLVYSSTLIIFFCNTRYRLPMLIILIPMAVISIEKGIEAFKNKEFKTMGVLSTIVCVCFLVAFLPIKGTDDMTAYFNTHALVLKAKGKSREAARYWEQSSAMKKPYSAFANLSLASYYSARGEIDKAKAFLALIPQTSFATSINYAILGDMARKKGRSKKAIQYYSKSLDINSGDRRVWQKYLAELKKVDPEKRIEEYKKFRAVLSFYR